MMVLGDQVFYVAPASSGFVREELDALGSEVFVLPLRKRNAHECLAPRLQFWINRAKRHGRSTGNRNIEHYTMKFVILFAEPVKTRQQHVSRWRSRFCPGIAKPASRSPAL